MTEQNQLLSAYANDDVVDEKELGGILKISPATLRKYRCVGGGPPFYKPPGTRIVRYVVGEGRAWLKSRRAYSTSELEVVSR